MNRRQVLVGSVAAGLAVGLRGRLGRPPPKEWMIPDWYVDPPRAADSVAESEWTADPGHYLAQLGPTELALLRLAAKQHPSWESFEQTRMVHLADDYVPLEDAAYDLYLDGILDLQEFEEMDGVSHTYVATPAGREVLEGGGLYQRPMVRAHRLAPGQVERRQFDHPGGTEYTIRSAATGSPERAYVERAAPLEVRGETLSELLGQGRLDPEDVMVALLTTREIACDPGYAGAVCACPYVLIERDPS